MYTIPAFGPWPEQNAGPDEEKRLNSAQQSKTSPTSIDREHETGVFYGSGKLPYQTSLAACTCNDFVKRKKPCKHVMLYFSSDPERPFPVHCTALRAKVNYSWILQRESVEIGGHFPISHPVLRCQHILKPALKLFLKCNSPAYIAKYSLEHLLHISTSRTLRTCHHR